jgi:hypothetical protein
MFQVLVQRTFGRPFRAMLASVAFRLQYRDHNARRSFLWGNDKWSETPTGEHADHCRKCYVHPEVR